MVLYWLLYFSDWFVPRNKDVLTVLKPGIWIGNLLSQSFIYYNSTYWYQHGVEPVTQTQNRDMIWCMHNLCTHINLTNAATAEFDNSSNEKTRYGKWKTRKIPKLALALARLYSHSLLTLAYILQKKMSWVFLGNLGPNHLISGLSVDIVPTISKFVCYHEAWS